MPKALSPIHVLLLFCVSGVLCLPNASYAVPSFYRQTGIACHACHTTYPQLSELGRDFKLKGYTLSTGQSKMPPLAMMLQPSFTHTAEGQPGGAGPGFDDNDNFALTQGSVFYAGRLFGPLADKSAALGKFGVFIQSTYDGVEKAWSWDNAEFRFADSASTEKHKFDYGLYLNNSPTMQDLWNTTPVWSFPYSGSGLAPTPDAETLLGGALAQQVAGFGGYLWLDDSVYLDLGGYDSLSARVQSDLGVDPEGEAQIDNPAPYWRLAKELSRGDHRLEIGTFGLSANTFPERDSSAGTDHYLDIGLDFEYQYAKDRHDVTVMFSGLRERQEWDASQELGLAENSTGALWNLAATGSYFFDKTYGATLQYFRIGGDTDTLLYADNRTGSPDSFGWILQLDYMPLNKKGGPKFWPGSNVKFSLQYTRYNKFDGASRNYDGSGRDANDNDTVYVEAWVAF
ncbi:cytochrome C [Microbulbifer hainanensis]|uniref:cytochrome C n=1 Tax=Microbulbifer hainanensis TaxID=2735675 RepID=UPI0018673646|nr:cytochrome C [Microbulbifer hainanensis]